MARQSKTSARKPAQKETTESNRAKPTTTTEVPSKKVPVSVVQGSSSVRGNSGTTTKPTTNGHSRLSTNKPTEKTPNGRENVKKGAKADDRQKKEDVNKREKEEDKKVVKKEDKKVEQKEKQEDKTVEKKHEKKEKQEDKTVEKKHEKKEKQEDKTVEKKEEKKKEHDNQSKQRKCAAVKAKPRCGWNDTAHCQWKDGGCFYIQGGSEAIPGKQNVQTIGSGRSSGHSMYEQNYTAGLMLLILLAFIQFFRN